MDLEGNTMKVAVCHEHGRPLTLENAKLNAPGPVEISVRVSACAICHSDIAYMSGAWGGELPAVSGHEAAGVIESVGSNVADFLPGDTVVVSLIKSCGHCHFCRRSTPVLCETQFPLDDCSSLTTSNGQRLRAEVRTGAFAQAVLIHRSQVVHIPQNMPPTSAALLACGVMTGIGAVMRSAELQPGESGLYHRL
jgi:S-(hydroxymethyl)glutathione dehydrogenase/alcohol dehydrogenase